VSDAVPLAGEPAIACAQTVIGALLAAGVREAVLAPGSRSAPFAYVLHAADLHGLLRLHVRIDERTAAFLALGLAKTAGCPVPVVTTSGTAAANLYPAVLEASAAGIPLLAITADRPAALRHSGANQTTDQLRLFGSHVRGFSAVEDAWRSVGAWRAEVDRLVALATGIRTRLPGPVQLNVALADPLVPAGPVLPVNSERPIGVSAAAAAAPLRLPAGPRTIVVAGDAPPSVGRAIAARCAEARVPLIAEPSSNARRGAAALAAGRILLASTLAPEIQRVVMFGRPTLSRPVNVLLARSDVELIVVSERADWPDPGLRQPRVVDAVDFEPAGDVQPAGELEPAGDLEPGSRAVRLRGAEDADSDWLTRWLAADTRVLARIDDVVAGTGTLNGPQVARTMVANLTAGTPLVLGSSSPIRDADLAAIRDDLGDVYANRGLAGIDGTISTAIGIAVATGLPSHALIGDLTFLHDLTGLVIGPDEPRPDLRVVVANDDGGSIFATLEHGRPAYAGVYERVFGTAHHADLAMLAGGLNLPVRRVHTSAELTAALREPPSGIEIVEAIVDRAGRRALDQAITGFAATL
jgi:2-succinyl-5-enolpyruvyl-6-hydroxy-3-cyclohexene-1-carboxylate synthase